MVMLQGQRVDFVSVQQRETCARWTNRTHKLLAQVVSADALGAYPTYMCLDISVLPHQEAGSKLSM